MSGKKGDSTGQRLKRAFLFLFVLVLAIGGLSVNYLFKHRITEPLELAIEDLNSSVQSFFFRPFARFRHVWEYYVNLRGVKEENRILKIRMEQLQQEITTYREALIENRRLAKLLELKRNRPEKTIAGRVIGFDLAPWHQVLTIDVGKEDGVQRHMPVLSQGGLIGQVVETGLHFSRVMLITDYNSRIAVMIQRNRVRGILKGQGGQGCVLDYIKKGVDVQHGDEIITSGMDGLFPKALLVGQVERVDSGDESDLFQRVLVRPSSELDYVEEVLVLLVTPKDSREE